MNNWTPRQGDQHKAQAMATLRAQNKTEQAELESSNGVRYSQLFKLPYFDPIESHVVDPMHNLLLGTAKHVFKVWLEKGILTTDKVNEIDKLMNAIGTVSEMGRATKSMSYFKSMKAEEWQHWVLVYSLYCLKDLLPRNHYNLWQVFVRACKLLISTSITSQDVRIAHDLLALFCTKFQQIMGADYCTPNMHMHLHLEECIINYGPVYAFWAFSFERYNGKLGSYHTNNRSLTITMMRKFLEGVQILSSYQQIEMEHLPSLSEFNLHDDSLTSTITSLDILRNKSVLEEFDLDTVLHSTLSVPKLDSLTNEGNEDLSTLVQQLYPSRCLQHTAKFIQSYQRIKLGRDIICTERYRGGSSKDQFVMARYVREGGVDIRPASVSEIFSARCSFTGRESPKEGMMFLKVKFFEEHQQRTWYGERCPMEIWSTSVQDVRIIPINYVKRKVTITKAKATFENFQLSGDGNRGMRVFDIVHFVI